MRVYAQSGEKKRATGGAGGGANAQNPGIIRQIGRGVANTVRRVRGSFLRVGRGR